MKNLESGYFLLVPSILEVVSKGRKNRDSCVRRRGSVDTWREIVDEFALKGGKRSLVVEYDMV